MSPFPLSLRWLVVPMVVGLAMPGIASQHEPFIDGNLTRQDDVLALDAKQSAELFDAVVEINSPGDDAFELVIESPPSFLAPLEKGWRLVAATDSPLPPLGGAESRLVDSGLLARLAAIETDDDNLLRLSLTPAELEDVVEEGSLTIIAVKLVSSEYEDFSVASLQGNAAPAMWRWLPAAFEERWEPCRSENTAFEHEETLHFTPQASARIRFQATLALKRQMSFAGGRLVEAQLEGRLCQGTEVTPRFTEQLTEEKTIWSRRRGPYYRMVGMIPIILNVNARLDAMLGTSAQFMPRDPIRLYHNSAGALLLQDGEWQPQPRPSHHQAPELPSLELDASIDATLALTPRLELILYASGGSYLEANATAHANWQPGEQAQSDLSLTLLGGLTYRKGFWGNDWEDKALKPVLYRWPDK